MKTTRIIVSTKQGLPNYSSRGVEVEVLADEGENLSIPKTIQFVNMQIREGWGDSSNVSACRVDVTQGGQPKKTPVAVNRSTEVKGYVPPVQEQLRESTAKQKASDLDGIFNDY